MVAITTNRQHGLLTKVSFFCGYFLLIFSAGTFASACVLVYNAQVAKTRWMELTAELRHCNLGVYDSTFHLGSGKVYALRCQMDYRIGGRLYRNSLHSDFTSSNRVRSDVLNWIALHGSGADVTLRVNPKSPYEYYVQSPMPIKGRREDADDYIYAGFVFAAAGLMLNAIGRRLARAGW